MRAETRIATVYCATVLVLAAASPAGALLGDCGQPVSRGVLPAAPDALLVLKSAIALEECETEVCDVTANCAITASDAKNVLGVSVGLAQVLGCREFCEPVPCADALAPVCGGACIEGSVCVPAASLDASLRAECEEDDPGDDDLEEEEEASDSPADDPDSEGDDGDSEGDDEEPEENDGAAATGGATTAGCVCVDATTLPTSTTTSTTLPPLPTTTTTTTTVVTPPPTSTTTTTTTTTTTLPPQPTTTTTTTTTTVVDIDPGRILYDEGCASCHKAAGYDTDGFAPDIGGDGRKLKADLTDITGSHAAIPDPPGPSLSSQELTDLRVFLDALVP